jgi:hypothetical protein
MLFHRHPALRGLALLGCAVFVHQVTGWTVNVHQVTGFTANVPQVTGLR